MAHDKISTIIILAILIVINILGSIFVVSPGLLGINPDEFSVKVYGDGETLKIPDSVYDKYFGNSSHPPILIINGQYLDIVIETYSNDYEPDNIIKIPGNKIKEWNYEEVVFEEAKAHIKDNKIIISLSKQNENDTFVNDDSSKNSYEDDVRNPNTGDEFLQTGNEQEQNKSEQQEEKRVTLKTNTYLYFTEPKQKIEGQFKIIEETQSETNKVSCYKIKTEDNIEGFIPKEEVVILNKLKSSGSNVSGYELKIENKDNRDQIMEYFSLFKNKSVVTKTGQKLEFTDLTTDNNDEIDYFITGEVNDLLKEYDWYNLQVVFYTNDENNFIAQFIDIDKDNPEMDYTNLIGELKAGQGSEPRIPILIGSDDNISKVTKEEEEETYTTLETTGEKKDIIEINKGNETGNKYWIHKEYINPSN